MLNRNALTETLHYIPQDFSNKPEKKIAICFHGFTSSPFMWRGLASELCSRGFEVFCPRLPFHGTEHLNDLSNFNSDEIENYLLQFTEITKGKKVYLIGSSFGALVALYFAKLVEVEAILLSATPLRINQIWPFSKIVSSIVRFIPKFTYWDSTKKDSGFPAKHGHAKYPLKLFYHIERLKKALFDSRPIKTQFLHTIFNENDSVISLSGIKLISKFKLIRTKLHIQKLPKSLLLPHDLFDSSHPRKRHDFAIELMMSSVMALTHH